MSISEAKPETSLLQCIVLLFFLNGMLIDDAGEEDSRVHVRPLLLPLGPLGR